MDSGKLYEPIDLSRGEFEGVHKINTFGMRLFEALDQQNQEEGNANTVLSPLGAGMAYTMFANGATPDVQKEFLKPMDVDVDGLADINSAFHILTSVLPTHDPAVDLALAQTIWSKNLPFLPTFKNKMTSYFGAEPLNGSVEDVNNWCKKATKGRINQILDKEPSCEVSLLSAFSFEGLWTDGKGFDKKDTYKQIFNGLSGPSSVDFMHSTKTRRGWIEVGAFYSIRLSFGNNDFDLCLVLPFPEREVLTTEELLKACLHNGVSVEGELAIPKFKIAPEKEYDLKKPLQTITDVDVYALPFTEMVDDFQSIQLVKFAQKPYFEIDEEGVKAIQVSHTDGGLTADQNFPLSLTFDRPFYFFLTESSTGAILLAGHITNL